MRADLPYRLLRTQGPGDATRFAREALESGARFLVAVGGDGTVHEVVNGMFDDEGKPIVPDAVLGVVAAGSGCDLIRTFGLPGDATRACHHLTGDNTYPLDIGKITYSAGDGERAVRYFVNVAEVGLGAAVAARAERMSPSLGRSKYFIGFWLTLPRFKLAEVRVVAGRRSYEGPAYLVVLGNAQYYGGGMKISPRSFPGDGVLDVLVFKGPKSDAFTMLPKIYRGEHLPHDHVEEFRVKSELHGGGRPGAADRGRRRGARDHPGHVRGPAAADPDEAMNAERFAERRRRATEAAEDAGLVGLLVSPGPDLGVPHRAHTAPARAADPAAPGRREGPGARRPRARAAVGRGRARDGRGRARRLA